MIGAMVGIRSIRAGGLALLLFALAASGADLHLQAREASLAGGKARYDGADNFRCIRGWTSTGITATWKCKIPTRGTWRVYITYACPPEIAGSEFELTLGDQKVNGVIASTERWENYKEMDLGPVIFRRPGDIEAVLRVTKGRNGDHWDVRSIRLVPET